MRFRWRDNDRRLVEFEACSVRELAVTALDAAIEMRRLPLPYRTLDLQYHSGARERPWRSLHPAARLSPVAERDAVAVRCRAAAWWRAMQADIDFQHQMAAKRGVIREANRRHAPARRVWLW